LCALSFMLRPRLTRIVPRDEHYSEPSAFPINIIQEAVKIIAPHFSRCVLVVENPNSEFTQTCSYVSDVGTIFSCEGQRHVIVENWIIGSSHPDTLAASLVRYTTPLRRSGQATAIITQTTLPSALRYAPQSLPRAATSNNPRPFSSSAAKSLRTGISSLASQA
jgi:hypothetical protein